jgi:hypothetical protein
MNQTIGSVRIAMFSASAPALAETFVRDDDAPATAPRNFESGDRRATLRGWHGR